MTRSCSHRNTTVISDAVRTYTIIVICSAVFSMRMLSPVGLNARLYCDYYGLPLCNIQGVRMVCFYSNSELDCIVIIRELMCVIALPLFDIADIDCMLDLLCTK